MTKVKVWLFTPESKTINIKYVDKDSSWSDFKPLLQLNDRDCLETVSFTSRNGNDYCILMDENGLYKDTKHNETFKKVMNKIKFNGFINHTGCYMVVKFESMGEEDECYGDMDLSVRQFIDEFNYALS